MSALSRFSLNCPFAPPKSILGALTKCLSLATLAISDTPLDASMIADTHLNLECISLFPVGEALRVGEGPYDLKYAEVAYYVREWRKKYRHFTRQPIARYTTSLLLTQLEKSARLGHMEISSNLCTLDELAAHDWPNLHTLILTGHAPSVETTELVDVLERMGQLRELRLLFAKTKFEGFRVLPNGPSVRSRSSPSLLSSLKSLALSNACNLEGVFNYANYLERLAIVAIIDLPRVPIALSRADVDQLLKEIAMSSTHLLHLRIMIEDKLSTEICHAISTHCPMLEVLEIELCGYHDGKSNFAWASRLQ